MPGAYLACAACDPLLLLAGMIDNLLASEKWMHCKHIEDVLYYKLYCSINVFIVPLGSFSFFTQHTTQNTKHKHKQRGSRLYIIRVDKPDVARISTRLISALLGYRIY